MHQRGAQSDALINNPSWNFSKIEAGLALQDRGPLNLTEPLTRWVPIRSRARSSTIIHDRRPRLDLNVPVLIDREAAVQASRSLSRNAMKYCAGTA